MDARPGLMARISRVALSPLIGARPMGGERELRDIEAWGPCFSGLHSKSWETQLRPPGARVGSTEGPWDSLRGRSLFEDRECKTWS